MKPVQETRPAASEGGGEVAVVPGAPGGFDFASALGRVKGDRRLLERFIRMFFERNAAEVKEIAAALAAGDVQTALRRVHTLKGSAGTVGAVDVQAAAAGLESALKEIATTTGSDVGGALAALETAWARALGVLAGLTEALAGPRD